ncbi:hypothetical protein NCAS_0B02230 [Naumovozyma castellii]|uniref:Derlin n=1 Tax=Naumovozyma castellii TaxID=27288 RepID=G0VBI1_NAUCA|nr:hypothetical protein NCAS_0B02230 [Naumovozyma castellii CBS 4309]CCC68307.1 hypothetical protein NCAS_0B02230 [Naumovozyma castellii CBS 4309]
MDVAILNIFNDIPIVTKIWTIGSLGMGVLSTTRIIDPTKLLYNYDLVFKKGQYERILYSLFNYGELNWISLLNIFINANHLTLLENSFAVKRRYCWVMFILLCMIISMTSLIQPISSLGVLLHENLVYYQLKKETGMNFRLMGGMNISPSLIPLYMNGVMYFVYKQSFLEVLLNFLPAHFVFYTDVILNRLYDFDLYQTPYDRWINRA